MDDLESLTHASVMKPAIEQTASAKSPFAELFIGGLLLMLALGGFAM